MAHDLSDCVELQACVLDMFGPFVLDISAKASEDRFIQGREIIPRHRLARRNGDVLTAAHGEDAAAHRAVMSCLVVAFPTHHRNDEAGEEIRMMRQYPEAARGVFGAQGKHSIFINYDRERRDNAQPHDGPSFLTATASFCRASSRVPIM